VLDALLHLHRDEPDAALRRLTPDPDRMPVHHRWHQQLWLPWYAAVWAEASGCVGADLDDRLPRAAAVAGANQVAQLIIERARLVAAGQHDLLPELAERLDSLECPYQAQRTRQLDRRRDPVDATAGVLSALSGRELEVLRLVTAGRSNPQIAAELFISRKTAERHVSNILTKLGVSTRGQAAVIATRHDL
jgi:DNA-binding NarL/FixJ family response regulator